MVLKFAIQTLIELAVVLLLIYGFCREDKLIELEDSLDSQVLRLAAHPRVTLKGSR